MSTDLRSSHFLYSSAREKILEHLFIGELLRDLWLRGAHNVEVLRSEVDGSGYDVVIDCNGYLRHIQLKTSRINGKTSRQNVNVSLQRKPSGCVIWMFFDEKTLKLGPFRWLGGDPGRPLPELGDVVARHTKGDSSGFKAERPNIRTINKNKFTRLATLSEVVQVLFGDFSAMPLSSGQDIGTSFSPDRAQ